jgi:hypothetical protein
MTVLAGLLCVLIVLSRFLHYAEAGGWGSILPAGFHNTTFSSVIIIIKDIFKTFVQTSRLWIAYTTTLQMKPYTTAECDKTEKERLTSYRWLRWKYNSVSSSVFSYSWMGHSCKTTGIILIGPHDRRRPMTGQYSSRYKKICFRDIHWIYRGGLQRWACVTDNVFLNPMTWYEGLSLCVYSEDGQKTFTVNKFRRIVG